MRGDKCALEFKQLALLSSVLCDFFLLCDFYRKSQSRRPLACHSITVWWCLFQQQQVILVPSSSLTSHLMLRASDNSANITFMGDLLNTQ